MHHISCCFCFFLTSDHWPLRTTCCPLPAVSRAAHCELSNRPQKAFLCILTADRARPQSPKNSSYPKRKSPAQAPGRTVFATQYAKPGALRRGRSRRGRPPRDRPLRKASPGGTDRVNPKQIFRQASKPLMAIVTPIAETACDA